MKYTDKLFANQPALSNLYTDDAPIETRILDYISRFSAQANDRRTDLIVPTTIGLEEMSTPPNMMALFDLLISVGGFKTILEIGTFVGQTTMQLADRIGPDARVVTIEIGAEFADISQRNFEKFGYTDRIDLRHGDARDIMKSFTSRDFDLVFIDGGKEYYLEYAIHALDIIKPSGIIIIDDIFFNGDAINDAPKTEKGKGCRAAIDYFLQYDGCKKTLLAESNGMLILHSFQRA